jgi:hypothetical protein
VAKAEALKYVVHLVGDLHQPLHDEDDIDKGNRAKIYGSVLCARSTPGISGSNE